MKRLVVLACAVGCGSSPGSVDAPAGPVPQVRGGFLRDADGRAMVMRGVNLSGSQKNAPYLDDKVAADYARVRTDWGMNAIRFIMTWSALEPEEGAYDDAYLDGVAERLQWAQDAGLSVILEMHEDIYGEGFGFDGAPRWTCDAARYAAFVPHDPWFLSSSDPNVQACVDGFFTRADLQDHFTEAWRRVAARFAGVEAVVGFDVLNEPNWGTYAVSQFEPDRLAPLYAKVVAAVRAEAPRWVAYLEPSASRNIGFATGLRMFDFPDVMYAPHSYDSMAESGGGFDPARRPIIIETVSELAGEAQMLGAGLWIGEYGGTGDSPGIGDYMAAEYDAAGAVAASTMYWAYDKSDGYGLLDPSGAEKPALLGAVVRPYPERVAGTPLSYAFDRASSVFTLTYSSDASMVAPTVVSVPARVYPTGYTVSCGGCAFTQSPGSLTITSPPSASPAVVTLAPSP